MTLSKRVENAYTAVFALKERKKLIQVDLVYSKIS